MSTASCLEGEALREQCIERIELRLQGIVVSQFRRSGYLTQ